MKVDKLSVSFDPDVGGDAGRSPQSAPAADCQAGSLTRRLRSCVPRICLTSSMVARPSMGLSLLRSSPGQPPNWACRTLRPPNPQQHERPDARLRTLARVSNLSRTSCEFECGKHTRAFLNVGVERFAPRPQLEQWLVHRAGTPMISSGLSTIEAVVDDRTASDLLEA